MHVKQQFSCRFIKSIAAHDLHRSLTKMNGIPLNRNVYFSPTKLIIVIYCDYKLKKKARVNFLLVRMVRV